MDAFFTLMNGVCIDSINQQCRTLLHLISLLDHVNQGRFGCGITQYVIHSSYYLLNVKNNSARVYLVWFESTSNKT